MGFHHILRTLRKRWITALLILLLVTGLAALATFLTPKTYQAGTQVFFSAKTGDSNTDMVSGSTYAQRQVQSYLAVAVSPSVLGPVIANLGLETTPEALASKVNVAIPEGTVLMNITVTDTDPKRAAQLATAITNQFAQTVNELETPPGGSASNMRVTSIRSAVIPKAPSAPSWPRNIALGVAVGLLLGLVTALVREQLDTTVDTAEDLERLVDLPTLGVVPFEENTPRFPLASTSGGRGLRVEAFNTLRTNLQFVGAGTGRRSLVVTSSKQGEGKSTTSANLAVSLAAVGKRVCLVEADLRRPRLLDYLGLEGSVGLTNVLIGEAQVGDLLQQFGSDNLWVLGAGAIPPNPSELLASPAMASLLHQLEGHFDMVLIDAPPLLPVTDAAILASQTGMTLLVVGLGVVEREDVRASMAALDKVEANVVGTIVNRAPVTTRTVGYYVYSAEEEKELGPRRAIQKQS